MVASTDIMLIHRHRSFLPHLSIVPNVNTEACVSPSVVDRTISSSGCSRRHAQAVIRASRNRPQAPKPHLRHSSSPRSPNQAITMRVTPNLLSKGFLGRSLDEFKRLSVIALKAEGTRHATAPYILASFHEPSSPSSCKVMSDGDMGGFSRAHLDWQGPSSRRLSDPSCNPNGHVKFHGSISIELPPSKPNIQRTGYAAFRTHDRPPTIFGKSLWDIDPYAFLALRVKSDGRKYFVNVQTESIVPTDLHQHRLYARRPGEWETVLIKWNEFVRTNHGVVVEPQAELLRQKVRTVGVGLIDRVPGDFELCVERIWATNGLSKEEVEEDGRAEEGTLKSRHGERIRWGEEGGKDG